jgi:hypothetical protein
MSDSTPKSVSFPIPVNHDDKRPLPEIIADYCGFPLAQKPVEGKQYYAVQDWLHGVAQTNEPRKFWDAMKRRLRKIGIEMSTWCRQLPYTATDGKRYTVAYAEAEILYRITQRMDANTGIPEAVLQFLARAGVVVDEFRIDPEKAIEGYRRMGKTDTWIALRMRSKLGRNRFTAAFRESMRTAPERMHYAIITDTMRIGLWKRTTKQLKQELNLDEKDSLRDNLTGAGLAYETLAEELSALELSQNNNLEFSQADEIVRSNSEFVGQHRHPHRTLPATRQNSKSRRQQVKGQCWYQLNF